MKITCQACAAKYTIADDKVQGKIVKIRCKKCGATIVVNGNDPAAGAGADQAAAARFDYAGQAGAEQWTVNVADGDQRTMTDGEIVEAYHGGVVNDETFCWKDGMGDWLPLREIEQLYAPVLRDARGHGPLRRASPCTRATRTRGSRRSSSRAEACSAKAAAAARLSRRPAAGMPARRLRTATPTPRRSRLAAPAVARPRPTCSAAPRRRAARKTS